VRWVLIQLLRAYRFAISPLYGEVCRYYPSCSAYALRAVEFHGAVRGSWLAARRLLRCHPWTPGGYDPVPGTPEWHEEQALRTAPGASRSPHRPGHHHTAPARGRATDPHTPDLQRVT
jgi:putative membrane protein insertion efficiency factor